MTYHCLIVDDEPLALTLLENYIAKIPSLSLVGKCQNAIQAAEMLEKGTVDMLFLDIQMPRLTGIELLHSLPAHQKPAVIFTTAYSEYAIEGYQLDVVDYLLKPFSFERFAQAVNKAIEWKKLRTAKTEAPADAPPPAKVPADYLIVKADHRLIRLPITDIVYVEGLKEYISFYTDKERIITLMSLKSLEERLPAHQFLRIHKSYIVNTNRVKALEGNQVVIGAKKLPIGKTYREKVVKKIFGGHQ